MTEIVYLSVADVLAIHDELIARYGGSLGLRDEGLLESAVMRPRMAAYYQGADLVRQAATFVAGLCYNHAFVDGNKRIAEMAGFVMLQANGVHVEADPLEFASAVLGSTELGNIDRAADELEQWLRANTTSSGASSIEP
jgi:death-on-curing protein